MGGASACFSVYVGLPRDPTSLNEIFNYLKWNWMRTTNNIESQVDFFYNYLTWTRLSVGQYDGHCDMVSVDGGGWIMPVTTRVFIRVNSFKIFTKSKNETNTPEKSFLN